MTETSAPTATPDDDNYEPPTANFAAGDSALVTNTGGDGVRFRAQPNAEAPIIAILGEGTDVAVVEGSTGVWVAVAANGRSGFVHGDFLVLQAGDGAADSGAGAGGVPENGALGPGDRAETTAVLNFRYQPNFGGAVGGEVPAGAVVGVTGGNTNGFYPVAWNGRSGYVFGEVLRRTDAPLTEGTAGGDGVGRGELAGGEPVTGGGAPGDFGNYGNIDGSISGMSLIWGGKSFAIGQEFGRTAFSVTTTIYRYGTAYGLDGRSHTGLDIGMPVGTPLYSPVVGTVTTAGGIPYYTYYGDGRPGVGALFIQTDSGDQIILGHMSAIAAKVGQRVRIGDFVGLAGGENGDHLHLEVRVLQSGGGYRIVDPRSFFFGGVWGTTSGGTTYGATTSARVGSDAESALSDAAASANNDLDAGAYGAYGGYGDAEAYGAYGDTTATSGDTVGSSSAGFGCAPDAIESCQPVVLNGKPGGGTIAGRR